MNSRWFLVQVTTSKRVIMENERERMLREELKKIQDSKPRGDSLLRLIRSLQRLQSSGPPAVGARSPSAERSEVARCVGKYLGTSEESSSLETKGSTSLSLRCGDDQIFITTQPGVVRCSHCSTCMPATVWSDHQREEGHSRCEPVYILRPQRR
jgi:hypothetical protein